MTLLAYLSRLFAIRFLAVLSALCALVELVEMLDATRKLVGPTSSLWNILAFSVLRLPLALEQMFLLAVLIAAVLSFRFLAHRNEMTVLRGAGLSPYRLLAMLLPFAGVLAVSYYALVDRAAPAAERAFTDWWSDIEQRQAEPDSAGHHLIWMRAGREIVSLEAAEERGRKLRGITRYLRNEEGRLVSRIRAPLAQYDAGVWRLHDVSVVRLEGNRPVSKHFAELEWAAAPTPTNFNDVSLPTERLDSGKSRDVLSGRWAGVANGAHYRMLVQQTYCAPLLPILMLLLAVPAAAGQGRNSRKAAWGMALSFSAGISFLFVRGFLVSLGEAEVLPPLLAIWAAPAVYLTAGAALVLHYEE